MMNEKKKSYFDVNENIEEEKHLKICIAFDKNLFFLTM